MQRQNENIFIYGVNSDGQSLTLALKWRPHDGLSGWARVDFEIKDETGNVYTLNEEDNVQLATHNQYKVAGIAVEVLAPMRRARVKVRAYLRKKGTDELVYVKIRLLWLALSNTFDFASDYDCLFTAKDAALFNSHKRLVFQVKLKLHY